MLNHFRGNIGYSGLYIGMFIGVCMLATVFNALASTLQIPNTEAVYGLVIFTAIFACAFVSMQRFMAIENRRPTLAEANIISLKSVGIMLLLLLFIGFLAALVFIIVKLFGMGPSGGEAGGPGARGGGTGGADNADPGAKYKVVLGVIAPIFLLYISPMLSFGLLSRLVRRTA